MSERRAAPPPRRRWYAVGVVMLLLAVVVAVVVQRARDAETLGPEPRPSRASAAACPDCLPSVSRPGPAIDLGVQASDRDHLRSRAEVDHLVDLARQAGATTISTTVDLADVRRTRGGPEDYSSLDLTAAAARAAGMTLRVTVYGLPAWAYDDGKAAARGHRPPRSVPELRAWRGLVEGLLTHLGDRIGYLEVWNEPNKEHYWATGPDPAEFAGLLRATESVVRTTAPDVRIVSGGIAGNDLAYLRGMVAALGTATPYDLLGLHPFTALAPDETGEQHADDDYDHRFTGMSAMAALAREAGHERPLYVTSFGYPVGPDLTDGERARYLRAALGRATAQPGLTALSWYYLAPTPWDDPRWTLLDRNLRPTATYRALQDWSRTRDRLTR